MLPWKPFLTVVPAGLLLGLLAGQATRPAMLAKEDRPWPYAADETTREADRWPSFDLSAPATATRGYSYRPDIDYDRFVWPDQTDRSAELLAANYGSGAFDASYETGDLPLTRRAVLELVAHPSDTVANEPAGEVVIADRPTTKSPPDAPPAAEGSGAFVLPPVPAPLARAGALPELAEGDEDEAF
jgi:hypothetical protein